MVRRDASLAWNPVVATWEMVPANDDAGRPPCDRRPLSTAEAMDLVEQLGELDPGSLVLAGEDPCAHPDFARMIGAATAGGLRLLLAPRDPSGLTVNASRRLAALGVRGLALGLDAPDAATHDRVRARPGSFAATWRAIAASRDAGLSLQIDTALGEHTVTHLPRLAETMLDVAPARWNLVFVVPSGRASPPPLDAGSCERVFHFLYRWSERTRVIVSTTAAPAYRRVVVQSAAGTRHAPRPRPGALNDGKGLVFVSHTGDVYPSALLPLTTGNVREDRLADVYRRSRLFRALRDESRLEGRCGVCGFRSLCGGSRARAYAGPGNFLAEDPACEYLPPGASRPGAQPAPGGPIRMRASTTRAPLPGVSTFTGFRSSSCSSGTTSTSAATRSITSTNASRSPGGLPR
jgi:radical SAM protein with 4Fe4S-binding SPASM domain